MHEAFFKEFEGYKDERGEEFQSIFIQRKTLNLSMRDLCREGFLNEAEKEDLHLLWMPYIRTLDFSQEKIKNEVVKTLAENLSAIDLDGLILEMSNIEPKDMNLLVQTMKCKKLRALNLSGNKIGDEGVECLSMDGIWTGLQAFI